MNNNTPSSTIQPDTDTPPLLHLKHREIQRKKKTNSQFISLSTAPTAWLHTLMVTASLGLMIYVGFTKELFFANERNSEFVFAVTMSIVLVLWYVHVANQLLKVRNIEFFADDEGAYILANRSPNDFFFIPWQRVVNHIVAKGYYNGSAAAITLYTDYTAVPDAIIKRGSAHGLMENGRAHFSVIPNCFVSYEEMSDIIESLRRRSSDTA